MTWLIDLAKHDSAWVLLDGAASWRQQGGWSGSSFEDPAEVAKANGPVHPMFEATGRNLVDFDGPLIGRWLGGDRTAVEAVDDALWSIHAQRGPGPSQRIILATRALERTLSRVRQDANDGWATATRRFLRAAWVRYALSNEVLAAGVAATWNMPGRYLENTEVYTEVHDTAFVVGDGPGRNFSVRGFASVGHKALTVMPAGSMEHRLIRDALNVLTSPAAAHQRLVELGRRFDLLLARTERQRNALVHGTGVADGVLATVDEFIITLARYAAKEAMDQALTGHEPLIEFERMRIAALEEEVRLSAGENPLDVLYPPDET